MTPQARLCRIGLCLALHACGGTAEGDGKANGTAAGFATQLDAPAPDYPAIIASEVLPGPVRDTTIEPTAPPPADAREIGEIWRSRLEARDVLSGLAYAGQGPGEGVVTFFDTLLSRDEFDALVRKNDWKIPAHIRFGFVEKLSHPAVSDAAEDRIRFWPQRAQRTGMQNMAALYGKVFVEDGCFFVTGLDGKTSLAWFLAETGLDVDDGGYLILIDRRTGWTMGRLGEPMSWAGPNPEPDEEETAELRAACGDHPVANVGNPHSEVRFEAEIARASAAGS